MGQNVMREDEKVVSGRDADGTPWIRSVPAEQGDKPHPRKYAKVTPAESDDKENEAKDKSAHPTTPAKPASKLTIMPTKELETIRAEMLEQAKENQELRHEVTVLENRYAKALYDRQLYWECGVNWAKQELAWQVEFARLNGQIKKLEETVAKLQGKKERQSAAGVGVAARPGKTVAGGNNLGGAAVDPAVTPTPEH
ncbi:hypothetical protein LTR10_022241 [Elasticomyces elasticus]|uniref:Uncharacterized protein n=1 Tax=Exophiala sideris TaxID=1016849 RepID=A0ABR0JSA0_9EURO|nr:hypothetical protein LTR10_022241 [Elasticomyces elasticus]KAK5040453.1 hypothetical protein LTS07_000951 [Exophiala sideris]KAK5043121.1 hypothetical protein LTR13_000892 [Exophiala sideris]KAK5068831.1 hypothetical protein LTR69_000952 [Exophiala sideris]KAK5186428.1 hypothetical protein LTR44_001484 [Eurotiomycetes sp. CCFEE 6388]